MGSATAATSKNGTAVGFYRSDFVKGIADEGPKQLSTHGYSYNIYSDAGVSQFTSALINKESEKYWGADSYIIYGDYSTTIN